jgi:hypothetical protein
MYNKIFSKIVDSSIWMEDIHVRLVWMMFIAIMDEDGFVNLASVKNVAHKARIDLPEAQEAIRILESPDPESSNPDNEGRRVTRVPGGWIVNNAEEYRKIVAREDAKQRTRERVKRYRDRNAGVTPCNASVTPSNDLVTPSDTDTDTDTEEKSARALEPVIDVKLEKKGKVDLEVMSKTDFIGPPRKFEETSPFPDPLGDLPADVAQDARHFWGLYCAEKYGAMLRNLHSETSHKEMRQFGLAIATFGDKARNALREYYQSPPKEFKQLAAFQVIIKLGLQNQPDNSATKKANLEKIANKKKSWG